MTDKKSSLFSLSEIGEILGSYSEGDPGFHRRLVSGVSVDSRTTDESDLFVAIKGPNHDGHDFLNVAFSRGAAAAVVNIDEARIRGLSGEKYFRVTDTLFALGELARRYRQKMTAGIVAVTGSNGKTTVKNLIYNVLASQGPALKSLGNFNNLVGLPISLLKLRLEHKMAVFELGMSARGEIARLSQIASPDVAVITNVGPVHLEFLKSVDEVAKAKLEILEHIKPAGTLVINGDDESLRGKITKLKQRVIRFGLEETNDIQPEGLYFDGRQLPFFRIENHEIALQLPGVHNVYNALAAYAAAQALGINLRQAAEAISAFHPEEMRSEILRKNDVTLLIDCYNANPVATQYALETLALMACGGRRIAVLGDMLELGEAAKAYHEEIGNIARRLKIDLIFAFGRFSRNTAEKFGEGGYYFEEKEGLINKLLEIVSKEDLILIKGSRGMALEDVVNVLMNKL